MTFIPTGPVTFSSMIIVWGLVLYGVYINKNGSRWISAALFVSWISARLATVFENELVFVTGMTIACLLSFKSNSREGNAISFFYGVRIILASILSLGLIDWYMLWILNRIFFYIQIIIAFGSMLPERGKRVLMKFAGVGLHS